MRYIRNERLDPRFNLALEELLLTGAAPEECFVLWRNPPTVVVGRHQIVGEEVDVPAAAAKAVQIVRRSTGGGAVFHDEGNVNYSFICDASTGVARQVESIAAALRGLGVDAVVGGRNDIFADGFKVSGFASCSHKGRTLCHGTLLFDSNLDTMNTLLAAGKTKYHATKVASVTSRVRNLRELLPGETTVGHFIDAIADFVAGSSAAEEYRLSDEDLGVIDGLIAEKYANPDWNRIEERPEFDRRYERQYAWGEIGIGLRVSSDLITHARIFGDLLADGRLDRLASEFVGRRVTPSELRIAVDEMDFEGIAAVDREVMRELLELE